MLFAATQSRAVAFVLIIVLGECRRCVHMCVCVCLCICLLAEFMTINPSAITRSKSFFSSFHFLFHDAVVVHLSKSNTHTFYVVVAVAAFKLRYSSFFW